MTVQPQNSTASNTSISSLLNDSHPIPSKPSTKPYACHQCDQTFSRSHNLKSHLATHSPEKPFQCNVCNHFFRRLHDLKRHQKLHTGEKPYACSYCSRSFARLDALSRHQSTYSGTACNNRNSTKPSSTKSAGTAEKPLTNQGPTMLSSSSSSSSDILTQSPTSMEAPLSLSLPPLRSNSLTTSLPQTSTQDLISPLRSWSYPTHLSNFAGTAHSSPSSPTFSRTLPSINTDRGFLQHRIRDLETENAALRTEIRNFNMDKQRLHDLEVENKVLKSLVRDQQQQQGDGHNKRLVTQSYSDPSKKCRID